MFAFLPHLFRLIWLFFAGHQELALENLALRQQLAIYKRKHKRPQLTRWDRLFWAALAEYWKGWRRCLFIVHPDTVVRWQRKRFRECWAKLSSGPDPRMGRPPIGQQVRELILAVARANPLWRAPRIHGELLKLGIAISERTVSRILRSIKWGPSQTWRTFLHNHIGEIVATDFFTVPTVRLRVLFVFVVLAHQRRRVLYFAVTEHPTSEWVSQQLVEAFGDRDAPRYLIHDRDGSYGREFRLRLTSLGMNDVITAPRSPRQNAFVELLIGSIRRECIDHVVVLNRRHLTRLLKKYFAYYQNSRTHLGLSKDAPEFRSVMAQGRIVVIPQVGGLHHRYERVAA
jgi:putative transposase